MGVSNKLLLWGWVDASGRPLTWRDLQKKPHRNPVGYWVGNGKPKSPIYDLDFQRQGNKQHLKG